MTFRIHICVALLSLCAAPLAAQEPNFGDDSSDYALDGECDDPRFVGWGVATTTEIANMGKDASDCAHLFRLGQIRLNRLQSDSSIAECREINFGDNSSEWANDGECDDPRFAGRSAAEIMSFGDIGRDAKDCRAACEKGQIWMR